MKERADVLMVQQGLVESREKAKRYIMAGQVYNEKEERIDKPGVKLSIETALYIKGKNQPYVSRGGLKLEKAIQTFHVDFTHANVLDIGSSTGGFSDVALQYGADHVYALDVGTNQLAWKIRNDERVTVMEQTNFRYSKKEDFKRGVPTIAVTDVSFISLRLILPPLRDILQLNGSAIILIKPQFEAGRSKVGKNGIIRDKKIHQEVIIECFDFIQRLGFDILDLTYSPITGGSGNIEFLAYLRNTKQLQGQINQMISISDVVDRAHRQFDTP